MIKYIYVKLGIYKKLNPLENTLYIISYKFDLYIILKVIDFA